jgi:hypothetical protein
MIDHTINRLSFITNTLPVILNEISEEEMSKKLLPNQWSKKEVIGHLIDSATNNHHRFIRGQFETLPEINYDQNKWNEYSFYQLIQSKQLILFWTFYNKQLIEIIKRIPVENLKREIKIGEKVLTLEILILDYVEHLEHHLKQITNY